MSQLMFRRAGATMDAADKGRWITTENGNHVHIDKSGNPDKGNPHVVKAMKKGGKSAVGKKSDKATAGNEESGKNSHTFNKGSVESSKPTEGSRDLSKRNEMFSIAKKLQSSRGMSIKDSRHYAKMMLKNRKSEAEAGKILDDMKKGGWHEIELSDIFWDESTPVAWRKSYFGSKKHRFSESELKKGLMEGKFEVLKS